jgi:hypothetical protein
MYRGPVGQDVVSRRRIRIVLELSALKIMKSTQKYVNINIRRVLNGNLLNEYNSNRWGLFKSSLPLIPPGLHFLGKGPASESFRFAGRPNERPVKPFAR